MKKNALVTGGARGIGKATVELFAENGYNVIINYNSSETEAKLLEHDLRLKKFNVLAVKADVSSLNQVIQMFDVANSTFGEVHILVNNAGVAMQKLFTETSEIEWNNIFNVNVNGVFNCCKVALKSMIKNHYGKIINVSSIWGITGASCEVVYSASKAALIGFTKALAKEVGPCNINVNAVAPGIIQTQMNDGLSADVVEQLKNDTPLCAIGTSEDIANAILFLASEKSKFITGQVISPNGGFVI